MRLIINAAKGQWRIIFAMLACTGLRCGEVCGLHVEDLMNLAACQIMVKRAIWRGLEISTKSKRSYRLVDIEPALAEMLRQHLNGRTTGRVFATKLGTPFSKDNLRRKLRDILLQLGLKSAGLHAFRHRRVSILQENKVPGDWIKAWVGHSSLRTTSRYTHFGPNFRL
jgi:integrase